MRRQLMLVRWNFIEWCFDTRQTKQRLFFRCYRNRKKIRVKCDKQHLPICLSLFPFLLQKKGGYGVSKVVSPSYGVTPAVYGGYGHGLATAYGHGYGMKYNMSLTPFFIWNYDRFCIPMFLENYSNRLWRNKSSYTGRGSNTRCKS